MQAGALRYQTRPDFQEVVHVSCPYPIRIMMVRFSAPVNRYGADMGTIGQRLLEERKRLGFNQTKFAALGGAAKRTIIDWEKDVAYPNAAFLAAIGKAGADVLYIVTGQRSVGVLPPRESALLDNYRNSDEEGKRTIESVAGLASQPPTAKSVTRKS